VEAMVAAVAVGGEGSYRMMENEERREKTEKRKNICRFGSIK